MEYRNDLKKYNSGKLQNVLLHIKNIYMKSKNKDMLKGKISMIMEKKRKIKISTVPVKGACLVRAFSFI